MSGPSLANMPPEIILHIFKSADNFTTVNALLRTTPVFYGIWCQNATIIANMVLRRTIEYFEEAQKLIDVQDQAEGSPRSLPNLPQGSPQVAVESVKRFQSNTSAVAKIFNIFDTSMNEARGRHLRPTEETRFKQAYYCLWTSICASRIPDDAKLLSSIVHATEENIRFDASTIIYWLLDVADAAVAAQVGITTEGAEGRELLLNAIRKMYAVSNKQFKLPPDARLLRDHIAIRFLGNPNSEGNFVSEPHPRQNITYDVF
ncbi:MAG: hypothetical protein Q9187_006709 [Circinaria calcarea]